MRIAGVLLPVTSLPGAPYVGDIGPSAYRFVEFLEMAGQRIWQVLPLTPTHPKLGNSPYNPLSLFGGNPLLLSLEKLREEGLLLEEELPKGGEGKEVDYEKAHQVKGKLLRLAYGRFRGGEEFERFCEENEFWLEDYALFCALVERFGLNWENWDESIRRRENLSGLVRAFRDEIRFYKFLQFFFFKQWLELKEFANSRGVKLFGDLPLYPSYWSADVWANPHLFKLDKNLRPTHQAGVPPDYFSQTGQLWGNPVYNWRAHEEEGFLWWIKRFRHSLRLYDLLRLDHFRGYIAYWEVPYGERTAVRGRWAEAPGEALLKKVLSFTQACRLVAEDLGYITPEVELLRRELGIPGMRVLQFGFLERNSQHLPHNCSEEFLLYTGTHDNPPIRGWYEVCGEEEKENLRDYLGFLPKAEEVCEFLLRLAYMSRARAVIVPIQDILCLGNEARMNTPGKAEGNWRWRLENLPQELSSHLMELTHVYGRQ